jgi:plasmid stabilization system protein ParE
MRDPRAALRFRSAADGIFDRIEESPEQFGEHGLLAVPNGRALFYLVRRAVLPPPFPYVVFFYVRHGTAIVLAIAHAKRRPGYWAERR